MAKKAKKSKQRTKKKKRVTKKKTVKKKTTLKAKKGPRKSKTKKVTTPKKGPELPAEPIGRVTHYFPKAHATAIRIEKDLVRIGDTLYYKGHTTHFKDVVRSLQINREAVTEAGAGQEVGIQVKARTREHDLVFKL